MPIWYILCPFGIFYAHLVYFMPIWYILWSFGTFFPVLVSCTKKNLATLPRASVYQKREARLVAGVAVLANFAVVRLRVAVFTGFGPAGKEWGGFTIEI
jgi:hypothetical protein